jgi:sarcosine oxidase subunit beta
VVLADVRGVAAGASSKAMGGVRQQFSTAAEVTLARESIQFFVELGPPYFLQVGYLFFATTHVGARELDERAAFQRALGVPVERVAVPAGVRGDDVQLAIACWDDGLADPPAVTRELVRRAQELGVELREGTDARDVDRDVLVVAAGAYSAELAAVPVRPLVRQLLETSPVDAPDDLPMIIEYETGFHFRRRGDRLVIAMQDPAPRWSFDEVADESVIPDRLERLALRYPAAAGARIDRAWAGLYDMTPDAHPIIGPVGDDVYAACGFSGHGFMQSPAVGRCVAAELLGEPPRIDLTPYRLDRFGGDEVFPEELIL